MKIRDITETPYLQKTLNTLGSQQKTGAPVPPNKLPKGPIKSGSVKAPLKQTNTQAQQQIVKPGKTVPMPTGANKETDYEVDKVQGDQVTMKTKRPTPQAPQSITVNKKDLDPVITNLQRRQKATQ
jgi:hypothetical protein|tara:strand:- start:111 stop:488 length:378 start_codon:yes stop_codon:yes gene_type:complete